LIKKVLVVDDVATIRKIIRAILEKNQFEVLEAANGMDAVNVMNSTRVDLVIMDMVMPDFGGLAALLNFRQIFEKTKVILMTGKVKEGSQDLQTMAEKLGVLHVLYKPFRKEQLLEVIKKIDT
jgi:CheY-like chemotaxis protein